MARSYLRFGRQGDRNARENVIRGRRRRRTPADRRRGGGEMIVVRFRIETQPDRADEVAEALAKVVSPSRELPGVVSFDVGRDVTDPNAFIATEVFDDREALDRQEEQQEVADAMALFETALAGAPEATIYTVASSEPYG
jgi:quinol monooxygenase YgiN